MVPTTLTTLGNETRLINANPTTNSKSELLETSTVKLNSNSTKIDNNLIKMSELSLINSNKKFDFGYFAKNQQQDLLSKALKEDKQENYNELQFNKSNELNQSNEKYIEKRRHQKRILREKYLKRLRDYSSPKYLKWSNARNSSNFIERLSNKSERLSKKKYENNNGSYQNSTVIAKKENKFIYFQTSTLSPLRELDVLTKNKTNKLSKRLIYYSSNNLTNFKSRKKRYAPNKLQVIFNLNQFKDSIY